MWFIFPQFPLLQQELPLKVPCSLQTQNKSEMELQQNICSSPQSECGESFTEQELRIVEAIEATYESSHSRKKGSTSDYTPEGRRKTGRQLPGSVLTSPPSRSFSPSRCQAGNLRMKYPAFSFGGKVLYSRTSTEVETAASELLRILESKKRETGQVAIGFDIEWRPSFKRGVLAGKAAVMQICGDISYCYVMHIIHSGITPSLQFILEDSALLKVGVGIGNDAVKVFRDYNVSVKAVEDLSYLANQKLGGNSRSWSLASLTEMLVCKELQKPNKIRLGNWEKDELSKDQLRYAATDAFASWHLYEVLKSLPESENDAVERSQEVKGDPR